MCKIHAISINHTGNQVHANEFGSSCEGNQVHVNEVGSSCEVEVKQMEIPKEPNQDNL